LVEFYKKLCYNIFCYGGKEKAINPSKEINSFFGYINQWIS